MTDTQDEKPLDPVARDILELLHYLEDGKSVSPQDVAKATADRVRKPKDGPELWRRYMNAAKQQALHLARTGQVEIIRKGEPADLNDLKGLWRIRLPKQD
ncbi:DUF3253 domain-containing protein [Aestuariispira insulae]|uniref:Uncharacterized protein DUF3253 n=1 Tax=Aestuariispira insulae TaxID=1461337 RepID=A0A3D9HEW9_9PROT|nr:DUF3253 domain-containing protein [Aestuariispira insulae]RED47995.1 uncharacterized protein DUF3253 [Aestuariispira insulae]